MKQLYSIFYAFIITITFPIFAMQDVMSFPIDAGKYLFRLQVKDVHNQVLTLKEARQYLVSASLVDKDGYTYVNHPHIIKNIIRNLFITLPLEKCSYCYESDFARELKTPGAKNYVVKSNQLFSEHLNEKSVQKLLDEGADSNYYRNVKGRMHDPQKYEISRHCYAGNPLIFYVSGKTDNDYRIAKLLLKDGANVNRCCSNLSPLQVAIRSHLTKMVELLLTYEPSISISFFGNDLEYALQYGNSEIVNLLLSYSKMDCKLGFRTAINGKNAPLLQDLFDHGASPDDIAKEILGDILGNPRLPTTEMLQMVCDNGVRKDILLQMLAQAKVREQRIKEVICILDQAANPENYTDVPDLCQCYEDEV